MSSKFYIQKTYLLVMNIFFINISTVFEITHFANSLAFFISKYKLFNINCDVKTEHQPFIQRCFPNKNTKYFRGTPTVSPYYLAKTKSIIKFNTPY